MFPEVFHKLATRPPKSHKYDYGHVLVMGGTPGMVGAPFLAASAALRVGSGLVTIASTSSVIDKLEHRTLEIMTLRLPDEPATALTIIADFITQRKVNALVLGPGMSAHSTPLVSGLLSTQPLPLILDGGALGALQSNLGLLKKAASEHVILTPHLGEFQRFFDTPLPTTDTKLLPLATHFATEYGVTLVLKGNPTYVISSKDIYKNTSGGPELATAGTGDVLAGMIGGLIAQGIQPERVGQAATYLHGLAGSLAAETKTPTGVIASDVIEAIPAALKSLS